MDGVRGVQKLAHVALQRTFAGHGPVQAYVCFCFCSALLFLGEFCTGEPFWGWLALCGFRSFVCFC